ncbi:hypothetical protein [Salibaculum halophilum]|uniref:hypothetical protein n=1 Tax=Salibaculum halophilum TaxID=1914408 RepID=UPI00117A3305|nr:hypothetical protein [Salibaculum halophilum]
MTWQPLWNDGLIISTHALAALVARGAGTLQVAMPKGTTGHLLLQFVWVCHRHLPDRRTDSLEPVQGR